MGRFPAGVKGGDPCSLVLSLCREQVSFTQRIQCRVFSLGLVLFVVIVLFKMAPKYRAEGLSRVSE